MQNYILKSDGSKEAWNSEKLAGSLRRAGASTDTIEHILDKIAIKKWKGESTEKIYKTVYKELKSREHITAMRYSVRRAIFELGPDGFPFEKFVSRIFKVWGYEAVTGQNLMGDCVEHEVDVVAWKKGEQSLAMAEVKFHNDAGLKSDLKVALYVKARFDDLSNKNFDYGGTKRQLSERYLFTNTKFSGSAITYGKCKDLKMISWNYPDSGNLYKIIDQNKLYPVTCLSLLTVGAKRELINKGVILCSEILANPESLNGIGLKKPEIVEVLNEVTEIGK